MVNLITLVQHYRAAQEFRCDLTKAALFTKPSLSLFLCILDVIPIAPLSTAALCLLPSLKPPYYEQARVISPHTHVRRLHIS